MQYNRKKKVCIVSRSLAEGGADRVASIQSFILSDLGYEVFIVTVLNDISYPFKGQLLNLGVLKEKKDTFLGRFQRLLILNRFLKSNQIDVVIDHRVRIKPWSEYVIAGFIYPKNTIYMVHNSTVNRYFPRINWLTRRIYTKAKYIVGVSVNISRKVALKYQFNHVKTIYNALDTSYIDEMIEKEINYNDDYIFWYGRLENEQKNILLLLRSYKQSRLPDNNIKLVLMGNGKDRDYLKQKIVDLGCSKLVTLLPFSHNPFSYVRNSRFTVLSSRYEGFPMTVLESLACGIPIVSVKYLNYEDGLIKDGFNGLLVENHNEQALSEGLNKFVEDKKLYLSCKENARPSIEPFKKEHIANQWKELIESI